MTIRAVIFDMDGLLIDSEPLAEQAWQAAVRLHGAEMTNDLFGRMLGLRQVECAAVVQAELRLPLAVEALCRQRNDLFMEIAPGRLKLMPGARDLLADLRRQGVLTALATSGERRYVDLVVRELDLGRAFDTRVVAEDVTHGKPAPEVYLVTAERLSVPPCDCLVLEDAPNGVAAAKAAGMQCVAVPNAYTSGADLSAANVRLPSLVAVRQHLDALLAMRPVRGGACPPPCSDGSCADCQKQ